MLSFFTKVIKNLQTTVFHNIYLFYSTKCTHCTLYIYSNYVEIVLLFFEENNTCFLWMLGSDFLKPFLALIFLNMFLFGWSVLSALSFYTFCTIFGGVGIEPSALRTQPEPLHVLPTLCIPFFTLHTLPEDEGHF